MASSVFLSSVEGSFARIGKRFDAKREPFGSFIKSSTVGVALFDRSLRCRALSPALGAMIGVSAKQKIGKPLRQVFPAEASHLETAFRHVWGTGNSLSDEELTAQSPSLSKKCIWLLNFYPIKDVLGQVQLVAATFSDVTKSRCAEMKLGKLRGKFLAGALSKQNALSDEFADLSVRTFELVRRSTELLDASLALRRHTLEMRIEAGLGRRALYLSGTRYQEFLSKSVQSAAESAAAPAPDPPSHSESPDESTMCAGSPSPRERQVLLFLADGKSNKEIGFILDLSTRTVECYRARIMLKLDLHSTAALVRYAIRNHIVEA
jgi:DNA-binding CsgD family transcriptional regulator